MVWPHGLGLYGGIEDGSAELCWHHELEKVEENVPTPLRSAPGGGG